MLNDNLEISNLIFAGNFIIFSKNEKNFISLLSTGHSVSKDIGMDSGIQKYCCLKKEN